MPVEMGVEARREGLTSLAAAVVTVRPSRHLAGTHPNGGTADIRGR
jgi:hypothetical protein